MTDPLSSVALVAGLFLLGVASPGPNFLVVAQRSMASGFRAGLATGLGVATGDALYAAAGFLGLAALVRDSGALFGAVKVLGGLYLAWIGMRMAWRARRGRGTAPGIAAGGARGVSPGLLRCFRAGLLTDLANPKTVVFFASLFALAHDPESSSAVAFATWLAIVVSSVLWRAALAAALSRRRPRELYARFRAGVEAFFGVLLALFGLRLAASARSG